MTISHDRVVFGDNDQVNCIWFVDDKYIPVGLVFLADCTSLLDRHTVLISMAVPLFDKFGLTFAAIVVCVVSFVGWLVLQGWAPPPDVVPAVRTNMCCSNHGLNQAARECIRYIPPPVFLFVALVVVNEAYLDRRERERWDLLLTIPWLLSVTPCSALCLLLLVGGRIHQQCQQRRRSNSGRDTGTTTATANNNTVIIANIANAAETNRSDDEVLVVGTAARYDTDDDDTDSDDDMEAGIQMRHQQQQQQQQQQTTATTTATTVG
jgi:hypothetical protein